MKLTKHWAATLDDYVIDLAWSPVAEVALRARGPAGPEADRFPGSASPAPTVLAAASAAGPISIFALADGARQHELPGHAGGTNVLAWMPERQTPEAGGQKPETGGQMTEEAGSKPTSDLRPLTSGSLLATGGQDGAVKFWDASAGQHTASAKLGTAWVEHLAWSSVGKADARGRKPEVRSQKSDDGSQSTEANRAPPTSDLRSPTSDLCPLTSGLLFAAAGRTLTALRPDASIAHTFQPAAKTITALAAQSACSELVESAGGSIAAACFGRVTLWDTNDFILQKEFRYANGIHALVWSPDNKWLVSGNQDPSVHLWIPEQDIELNMSGYEGKVKYLSFDHTARWLATSGGRDACIWDCLGAGPEGREPTMLPHGAPVCAVAFQHGHGLLATGAQDGTVQLWSLERGQPLRATVKMPSAATRFAWSPDDRYLAIGSEKGAVYVLKCEA